MTSIFNRQNQKQKRRDLRNASTRPEILVWSQLKGRKLLGHKFHRQYGIGPYIADFYCPAVKLVIELDGESHYEESADEYDKSREEYMSRLGIKTLRILNSEVIDNLDGVFEGIERIVAEREKAVAGAFEKRNRKSK